MNQTKGFDFEPVGFFVIRTPLLPVDDFLSWGRSLEAVVALDDDLSLEAALSTDAHQLRQHLKKVLDRPEVYEALRLASPGFVESLEGWRRDPESRKGKRTEHALVRYFSRMTSRPSPFGLFSGWTVGYKREVTRLRIRGRATYRRHTQIDSSYVESLGLALTERPDLAARVTFEPNETIYECAGRIKYSEESPQGLLYHSTVRTPHLAALLEVARNGATVPQLVAALSASVAGLSVGGAESYVRSAIRGGLLKSQLVPPVTGPAALDWLRDAAENVGDSQVTGALRSTAVGLDTLDRNGVCVRSPDEAVISNLPPVGSPIRPSGALHVSLIKPAEAVSLGPEVFRELDRTIDVLRHVGVVNAHIDSAHTAFRDAFRERYGSRYVRLVELFDPETGLPGIADDEGLAPLVHNLGIGPVVSPPAQGHIRRHHRLRRKIALAADSYAPEVTLTIADLDPEDDLKFRFPESFHVWMSLEAESDSAFSQGRFRIIAPSIAGPPGTRTLGRFCLSDPELRALVVGASRLEAQSRPDVIFAEISYAPSGPARNVVQRPVFHEYEIPYLGRSGVVKEKQIAVSDLWVSVSGERITLFSKRLAREVVPRLSCAHAYWMASTPQLYRFLCRVAQSRIPVSTFWEADDSRPVYLPRVVCGRAVLSVASWRVDAREFEHLQPLDTAAQFKAVQELRQKFRWPRHIGFVDGEQTLLVDLDNAMSTGAFVPLLRGRQTPVMFSEWVPGAGMHPVRGPEGRFAHEVVVPYITRQPSRPAMNLRRSAEASIELHRGLRRSHPGSRWVYAKLYVNPSAADRVLRDLVAPLVATWFSNEFADRWFFIRYGDPEPHIRLRVRWTGKEPFASALSEIGQRLDVEPFRSLVWKVQYETYEREVERYGGGHGIDLAERLFQADSDCVLELVSTPVARDPATRWVLAAKGMDSLLTDLGLSLRERIVFATRYKSGWWQLLQCRPALRSKLAAKYRRERSKLEAMLLGTIDATQQVDAAFARRSRQVVQLAAELSELATAGQLTTSRVELDQSYVHMHVNRLLPDKNNSHELVISDFLCKFYEGRLARLPEHASADAGAPVRE